jgi:predicted peptidase
VSQSYRSDTPAPLVLLLHFGYHGDQPDPFIGDSMIRLFKESFEDCGGIALAPDVLSGTWTDGRNERGAVWLVRNVMSVYNIDSRRVIVAGYSMGGQGTWFIGSRHQDLFTGAIPIAARPAGSTSWTIPVCAVHSKVDEICPFTAAQQHVDDVRASGAFVEFLTVDDYGHYEMPRYAPQFAQALKTVFEHTPR